MKPLILLTLLVSFLFSSSLRPEQLYVVYTYNFLKNIGWSKQEKLNEYKLLVVTNNEYLKENFKLLSENRSLDGKKIHVDFEVNKGLKNYNAIFINKDKLENYNELYVKTEGTQTLMITNQYPDKQRIMINLKELDTSKISFEVNRANILNDGLKISDEMVLLGGTEVDVAKLYKQTRQSLEDEEKHSQELMQTIQYSEKKAEFLANHILSQNKVIQEKEKQTREKEKELLATKEKILVQEKVILKKLLEVKRQKQVIENLKTDIENAKSELDKISEQVSVKTNEMQEQKQELEILNSKALKKDSEISDLDKTLQDLKEKIDKHQSVLVLKEETIDSQKGIISLLLVFILIVTLLIIILVKLFRENKRHAERDFLTGLYNRRFFATRANKIYLKSSKASNSLKLGIIDIDYFKSVNDNYGHDMGDEVLQEISKAMQDVLGEKILMARWGGEEFIVLFDLPKKECVTLFETLKKRVSSLVFYPKDKDPFSLTISTGVHFIKENDSIKTMIEEADKLLYNAKEQGRNRIVYSD